MKKHDYTEIRCEACGNFRGSNNWEKKHYYSYSVENWENPIQCKYSEMNAKFKAYTVEQKKEILEIYVKDDNEIKKPTVSCTCWRKKGVCAKHNHHIRWENGECVKCATKRNNHK